LTFISVAIVGLTMGILATVLPTYRASRVDPVVALRGEQ
jgi:ABC-type lipoprotein release transport system permease subunit